MQKKSDVELQRAALIKVNRTLIRLKHALAADKELNETIPDLELQFDSQVQQGLLPEISVPKPTSGE